MANVNYTVDAYYGIHTLVRTDMVIVTPRGGWQDSAEKFMGVESLVQNKRLL